MEKLIELIIKQLPNNEIRSRVLIVLEKWKNNPTQEWLDALRQATSEADATLTERYWNS